ncbi:hypothetical protein MR578_08630 [bacterium]|nr:hypothetical protein [bacterium]
MKSSKETPLSKESEKARQLPKPTSGRFFKGFPKKSQWKHLMIQKEPEPERPPNKLERSEKAKPAGFRKEGDSSPMANFKDPIHHRRAWAC